MYWVLKWKYALDQSLSYTASCIIKTLNMDNLFWKTAHPEPSLLLSPSMLSRAFQYSSTAYQTSQQKQTFHKPECITQMKQLSTQLHRRCNKGFTGPTLDTSTWKPWLQALPLFHNILLPNKHSTHVYSFPKGPVFIDSYLVYIWSFSDFLPFSAVPSN